MDGVERAQDLGFSQEKIEVTLQKGVVAGAIGAAFAALVASSCCLGPIVFALLGAGGALAAASIEPYRGWLLLVSFALLAAGFWRSARRGMRPHSALWIATVVVIVSALLPLAGCKLEGEAKQHRTLGAGFEPLRSAFNRDVGKVRLVMLVAPT